MDIDYEWDDVKAIQNIEKHGVSFLSVYDFNWDEALVIEDDRKNYGEVRYNALAPIGSRLHSLTFCIRNNAIRVISLRKASKQEVRYYAQK